MFLAWNDEGEQQRAARGLHNSDKSLLYKIKQTGAFEEEAWGLKRDL